MGTLMQNKKIIQTAKVTSSDLSSSVESFGPFTLYFNFGNPSALLVKV